jgi:hypothetical protein
LGIARGVKRSGHFFKEASPRSLALALAQKIESKKLPVIAIDFFAKLASAHETEGSRLVLGNKC